MPRTMCKIETVYFIFHAPRVFRRTFLVDSFLFFFLGPISFLLSVSSFFSFIFSSFVFSFLFHLSFLDFRDGSGCLGALLGGSLGVFVGLPGHLWVLWLVLGIIIIIIIMLEDRVM